MAWKKGLVAGSILILTCYHIHKALPRHRGISQISDLWQLIGRPGKSISQPWQQGCAAWRAAGNAGQEQDGCWSQCYCASATSQAQLPPAVEPRDCRAPWFRFAPLPHGSVVRLRLVAVWRFCCAGWRCQHLWSSFCSLLVLRYFHACKLHLV